MGTPGMSLLSTLPTPTWQTAAWVVGVFAVAWLVSRLSGRLAGWIVRRRGRRAVGSASSPSSGEGGRARVAEGARRGTAGPARRARVPWAGEVEHLEGELVRIRSRATVAHGRGWLVETFLPDLRKER